MLTWRTTCGLPGCQCGWLAGACTRASTGHALLPRRPTCQSSDPRLAPRLEPPCSSYAPAFLGAAALCFPGGFNKTGLLDDIKFKARRGALVLSSSSG